MFGLVAYHRLAVWRIEKEQHDIFYKSFKDSFIPAIKILLKESGTFKSDDFIDFQETFDNQNIAMLKIQDSLKGRRLKRFNNKWQKYKTWQKDCEDYESTVMTISFKDNRTNIIELMPLQASVW